MDVATLKAVAAQLRRPEGAAGVEIGLRMNESNRYMNLFAVEALAAEPGEHILEIGMGNGEFIEMIVNADPSIRYTGSDYSQTMIDVASTRNEALVRSGQVQFTLATADALPYADNSFDKIVTVNTIYFWQPGKELAELHRVLKPGGKLFLAIRPKAIMADFPFTNYGFTLYSSDELSDVLTSNNFTVSSMEHKREPEVELDGKLRSFETVIAIAQPNK